MIRTLRFAAKDRRSFDEIRTGRKLVETRAATVKYQPIEVGDELVFSCAGEKFSKKVARKYHWASVEEMVKEVPLASIIPWVDSIEEAKDVYASFPGYEEKIREFGLFGWQLK
jgi:ASC-1-like (ASCH) protein